VEINLIKMLKDSLLKVEESMKPQEESDLKKQMIEIARRAGSRRWCPGISGNISVIDSTQQRIYIKATRTDMKNLETKDVMVLDLDGRVLEGEGKPSTEEKIHLCIYKLRNDVKAVLHVHSPYATAYATAGKKIPLLTDAARMELGDVPLLEYAVGGSVESAENVSRAFKDPKMKAVLLREHGTLSVGETLEKAYYIADWVEDAAKVAFLSSLIKTLDYLWRRFL